MIETNFKHTEIGLIPHDWEVKELVELLNYQQPTQYLVASSVYQEQGIPVLTAGKTFVLGYTNEKDGIFTKLPVIIFDDFTTDSKYVTFPFKAKSSAMKMLHLKNENADLRFVFEKMQMIDFPLKDHKRYWISTYSKLPISLPSTLVEQERIAGALSSIDTLIGALNEQIEKKRHIKQGTMQQLLTGKKRLAGFTGEWVTEIIKDICDRYDHLRIPVASNLRIKGLTPYYGANGIQDYVDGYTHDGEFILLAEDGANNLVDYPIRYVSGKIWVNNHAHVLSAKEKKADTRFLAYVLKTIDFESNIVGSGRAKLNAETLMQLEVSIPPSIAEQSAIAAVLSGMDTEIAALEQKRDKYIAVKQGMMQQLLTGRIRLLEEETQEKPIVQTIQPLQKQRTANVFFRRSVLAAEIADRLCEKRRFGHVKMEKLIFMTEKMCGIDLASHYHRDAAGPYDNRALRSIDSQLKKQKWFEAKSITDENGNRRYTYMPLANRGGHKQYFDLYYADVLPEFDNVINTMADWDTEHCEIIATLYSAWEDLLHSGNAFTDDDILNELYHRWHDSKKRFSAPRLLSALTWMRQNNFIPKE